MRFATFWLVFVLTVDVWASTIPLYRVGNREQNWSRGAGNTDTYLDKVQPIFSSRCVACHGCYEAPCQLNLQSYDGVSRGFHATPLYFGKRVEKTAPTRMSDAASIARWRELNFLPVVATTAELGRKPSLAEQEDSLLYRFLNQAQLHNRPGFAVADLTEIQKTLSEYKPQCVATDAQVRDHFTQANPWEVVSFEAFTRKSKFVGMPFGLLPLSAGEQGEANVIQDWLAAGAPGPKSEKEPGTAVSNLELLESSANAPEVEVWEAFFNTNSAKGRHTARYIYEHVFSAVITFEEIPGEFYELVRSSTRTGAIKEVVTELPYELPKATTFHYRLRKITRAMPQKTQNVWQMNRKQLAHLTQLFHLHPQWAAKVPEPVYGSTNPFEYFAPLPAAARSQFLRENSRLIVGAMVQGTVCIGSRATYAIADHFWAWFLDPASDPSVTDPELGLASISTLGTAPQPYEPKTLVGRQLVAALEAWNTSDLQAGREILNRLRSLQKIVSLRVATEAEDHLVLDVVRELKTAKVKAVEIIGALEHLVRTVDANRDYQEAFEKSLRALLEKKGKKGLDLNDLWEVKGSNPNAWLNITRHELSATVQYGPQGGSPQSIWVLSYSNFERLYYNLVASFRVWGSITHKLATWRHMSYVRLEGEDLALSFLPIEHRETARQLFTSGLGEIKNSVFFPLMSTETFGFGFRRSPPRPHAVSELSAKQEPQESLDTLVRLLKGRFQERFRAELVTLPPALQALLPTGEFSQGTAYARFLPNIVYLRVTGTSRETDRYFSLVADKAYKGHNLVLLEKLNRHPEMDSLSVYPGFVGAYPGMFLTVEESRLANLARDIQGLRSEADWQGLRKTYGISRTSTDFWPFFDAIHEWKSSVHPGNHPIEQGIVDLSQYELY